MPATNYRIWGWGAPVNTGTSGAMRIGVSGIAKPASPEHPMELVNEIICGDLGRALRLPIPPGIIVTKESDHVRHHVSLDFSQAGEALPPADPTAIATDFPDLACGVILFDLWIANGDRHEKNLSYDTSAKAIQLFDHGRALFCGKTGRKRLEALDDRDIINGHCLTGEIRTLDGFENWNEKIRSLPKFYISETVADAVKLGLPQDDAEFCTDFLLARRSRLMKLLRKYKGEFFNAPPTFHGLN
jgi:hypothetical protein